MSNMATVSTCDKCGLSYRDSLIPHQCAEWTKGRKEAKETQPMSDTLQEREWCDDCHGYTHMPYCPSYEPPETEANQLLPDGISSVSAGSEHQPAARGGGDETPERVWLTRKYGNRIWKPKAGVKAELQEYIRMDQHQSLVAERERLRDILRKTLKAIEVIDFSNCREGAYDSIPWTEIEEAVNEQRSTSE